MPLPWLPPDAPPEAFPPLALALAEPDGLLCAGGDLSPARLLAAYRRGIFPWYSAGEPILWWSPDPRAVLFPAELHVPRRLARLLRQGPFSYTWDRAFGAVIRACADMPRPGQHGTWITPAMRKAYTRLHHLGHAHSLEVWQDDTLVAGVYGIAIGAVFFGESMFTRVANASKAGLVQMLRWLEHKGFGLLDCQQASPHVMQLGARLIPRANFVRQLDRLCAAPTRPGPWTQVNAWTTTPNA